MGKIYKFKNAKVSVDVDNNLVVIVNEPYQPEDGEIVMFEDRNDSVFIYRKNEYDLGTAYYAALSCGEILFYNDPEHHMLRGRNCEDMVPASEESKQLLYDALKKQNLMWDPIKRELVRWRAEMNKAYYAIDSTGVRSKIDTYDTNDDFRFIYGNYFPTEELANKAWEEVFKLFRNKINN